MMEETFGALYISQDILTNNFNTLRLALGATERVSMRLSESRSTGLRSLVRSILETDEINVSAIS